MPSRVRTGHDLRAALSLRLGTAVLALFAAAPALAQDLSGQDEELAAPYASPSPSPTPVTVGARAAGNLAKTTIGDPGQRRTRGEAGIEPIAKINSRISNRVQSRIRNRIDRNYDPLANATSPFQAAEEQTRRAGRPRVR